MRQTSSWKGSKVLTLYIDSTVWEDSRTRRLADRALVRNFWGISDVKRIAATGLDVWGADFEAILSKMEKQIDAMGAEL